MTQYKFNIISCILILSLVSCSIKPAIENLPFDDQIKAYKIATNDSDYKAYYDLAMLYLVDNNAELAIKNFKQCIRHNPEYYDAYNNLGYVYFQMNQLDEAILNYKKALFIKKDLGIAHYNLALAYFKTEQIDLCVKHIKLAKYHEPALTEKVNKMMLILP